MTDKLLYSWLILKLKCLVKLGVQSNMSRYIFLLFEAWCRCWPNCVQMALPRGLSDHCPIMLSIDVENWGP
jgi:hypothetical protein